MSRSNRKLIPRLASRVLCAVLLLFSISSFNGASATTIDVINQCPYPIWPGVQSNVGSVNPEMSGFHLLPGAAFPVQAPYSWSGRIWARTMCSSDPSTGNLTCATGSCASGAVQCNGFGPKPPVSLAQFNLGSSAEDATDHYDISLADGFNVPLKVVPMGYGDGSSDCRVAQCDSDVDVQCTVEETSPHICPTAKTPSFKLVFCPVPTKQVPDGHPPVAPPPTPTDDQPPSTNITPVPPVPPASAPAPASDTHHKDLPPVHDPPASAPAPESSSSSSSSSDTHHKDPPEIGITILEPPAAAAASAPAPTPDRRGGGFVLVTPASTSKSTRLLLAAGAAALVVVLLAIALFPIYLFYFCGESTGSGASCSEQ